VKQTHRRRRGPRLDLPAILLAPAGVVIVLLAQYAHGAAVGTLVQGGAALIVFGGTAGAVLLTFSLADVGAAFGAAAKAFRRQEQDIESLVATLVSMSMRAHRNGMLSLDADVDTISDPFLSEGLMLAVDGTPPPVFRELLNVERSARDSQDEAPARVFEAAAGYAPTMGILGAVLGLMRVMENLGSPGALGAGIAVAFVATVYGVGVANLVLLPLAGRLRERAANAARRREVIAHGLEAINQRLNPRLVARRLRAFSDGAPRSADLAAWTAARAGSSRLPA
jgi:chemotaxis protein MotA